MAGSFGMIGATSMEIIDTSPILDNIGYTNFENFDKVCRFCLGSVNLKPFFNITYQQASVQSIIYDCSSIKVYPEDGLPYNLCKACLTEFIRFYRFKKRCIKVTSVLQEVYNKNFPKENEEMIESINSESYSENDINLIIKKEEIEDPLSDRGDCVLENMNSDSLLIERKDIEDYAVHYDNTYEDTNSGNLTIKNEGIESVATSCNDNVSQDYTKYDNVIVKNEIEDADDNVREEYNDDNAMDYATGNLMSSNNWEYDEMVHMEESSRSSRSEKTVISPYNCSVCQKSFSCKSSLTRHTASHTGENPMKCSVCGKAFVWRSNLSKHMLTHTGERPHKCSVCWKSFITKSHLNAHMIIHTRKNPHKCTICEQSFYQNSELDRHMLACHNSERRHQCSICSKSVISKSYLKMHMLIHAGAKPHKCTICEKSFIWSSDLRTHMLIHTGERPHKCGICSKSFTHTSHLNAHRLIHTGERPHKCTICRKYFRTKSVINRHMLIHTGENPFTCTVCKRSFNRKSTLNVHMLTHTTDTEVVENNGTINTVYQNKV